MDLVLDGAFGGILIMWDKRVVDLVKHYVKNLFSSITLNVMIMEKNGAMLVFMDQPIVMGGCCGMTQLLSMKGEKFHGVLKVISTLPSFSMKEKVPLFCHGICISS